MARAAPLILVLMGALALFNLTVAFFGSSFISPLSVFFLREKALALQLYGQHRVGCLWRSDPPLPPLIAQAEKKHRLPRGLLRALVEVESEGRVHRISFAGAMGPAQITAATAASLRLQDPFDPESAIDASGRLLATLLRSEGSVPLALAAYNAGPGNVNGRVPKNGETEVYVKKVLAAYSRFRR